MIPFREVPTKSMTENPPYTITSNILDLVERIGEAIGRVEEAAASTDLRLRRINRIRTIRGSLAIEGNTLSEEQVSTILDGKPVIAPLREIQEARNAIKAYEQYPQWEPASETDLLSAHEVLMAALVDAPGHYRRGGVAVAGAGEVHHIGPPADRVPHLMSDLLSWLNSTTEHPHSPGYLRGAGGNDPSRVADGEEPEVSAYNTWSSTSGVLVMTTQVLPTGTRQRPLVHWRTGAVAEPHVPVGKEIPA